MAEPVIDDLRAAVIVDGHEGRVDARLGVGMASLDVEHAGGGGGDDDAGARRRAVAPVDGGREVGGRGERVGVGEGGDDRRAAAARRRCWPAARPRVLRRSARRRR